MVAQISPQLLQEWEKGGKLMAIWRCERCFKKVLLYETHNEFINSIYISFSRFEKYCQECKNKMKGNPVLKTKIVREVILLKKYEGIIEEDGDE